MEEQEDRYLVRGSGEWFLYMIPQLGIFRVIVSTVMDFLAICGPLFLLIYIGYCGVKTAVWIDHPSETFPQTLEILMFCLQLGGLEGSIPGLARRETALREQEKNKQADRVLRTRKSARWMTILAVGEGALHVFTFIDASIFQWISAILLVIRSVVIINFLAEMAVAEMATPRVISRRRHREIITRRESQENQQHEIARLQEERQKKEDEHAQALARIQQEHAQALFTLRADIQRERTEAQTRSNEERANLHAEQTRERQAHALALENLRRELTSKPVKQEERAPRKIGLVKKEEASEKAEPIEIIGGYDPKVKAYPNLLNDGFEYLTKAEAAARWDLSEKSVIGIMNRNPECVVVCRKSVQEDTVLARLVRSDARVRDQKAS